MYSLFVSERSDGAFDYRTGIGEGITLTVFRGKI